jgi:hypothetical protein
MCSAVRASCDGALTVESSISCALAVLCIDHHCSGFPVPWRAQHAEAPSGHVDRSTVQAAAAYMCLHSLHVANERVLILLRSADKVDFTRDKTVGGIQTHT